MLEDQKKQLESRLWEIANTSFLTGITKIKLFLRRIL